MTTPALKIDGRTLVTCQEAARLYGCTMGYVRRLARDGRVHATTVGRTWFVDRDEVMRIAQESGHMARGFVAN